MRAGGHEAFKQRKVVTCSDGETFPLTMMGMQAADMHEADLKRIRPKPKSSLVLNLGDWRFSLSLSQFVVSKTDRYRGGSRTWYPVHIGWTKGAPLGRHFNIHRTYEGLQKARAARAIRHNSGRSLRVR